MFGRATITLGIGPHSSFILFLMVVLCNNEDHYIFALFSSSSFFFLRLISAVADWISAILPHMVWPSANLGCRSETCCTRLAGNAGPKSRQKSPSEHHRTVKQQ